MSSPIPITSLSAAFTLVSWIQAHGREPTARECRTRGSNGGLLLYDTYRRKLPGTTFSACISAARLLVSHAPRPRIQTCLGPECETRFAFQGYHFCSSCRATLGYDDEDSGRNGKYHLAHDRDAAEREGDMGLTTGRTVRMAGTDGVLYVASLSGQTLPTPNLDSEWSDDEEHGALHGDSETARYDTVYGFDDLIASQMNAWQRVSRKRRFFEGA